MTREALFDENLIARNRLRAARAFRPGADFLLKAVADDLGERLAIVDRSFAVGVDLHGYSGLLSDIMEASGKVDHVVRVETACEVMAECRQARRECRVSSLETVPIEQETADLVISPLSLHLTNDTPGVMVQISRSLRPNGLFLGAMAGAGTLGELRASLLAAESETAGGVSPRVIPFADVRDAGALLQRAGLALPVADMESYTVRYDDMFALMRDLRAMGMQNPLAGRSRKPARRGLFLRAAQIYADRFSDPDGRIRASFNIIYLSGWKPHESQQQPMKPGSAQVSLATILGKDEND